MEEGGSGGRGFRVGETKEQEVEVGGQDRREKMRKREKRKERGERESEREREWGRGKALSSALLKSPFLPPFLKASYGTRGNCESTWKLLKSPTTLPWLSAASRQEAAATSHPVTETRTYCDYPSMCCNIATILCIKHRVPSLLPTVARRTPASQPASQPPFLPTWNPSWTAFDRVKATLRREAATHYAVKAGRKNFDIGKFVWKRLWSGMKKFSAIYSLALWRSLKLAS